MIDLDKIYLEKFGEGDNVTNLGWGSTKSQESRFKVLLEIPGYIIGDSVLDVGCGYGDLSNYAENYTGIDLREKCIEIAGNRYPKIREKFIHSSIFDIENQFDWIVASGIFCFKDDWDININLHLSRILNISKKGVAINFLSDLSKGTRDSSMKYAKISECSDIIGKYTNRFIIRHDYLPNDFTVYIYK